MVERNESLDSWISDGKRIGGWSRVTVSYAVDLEQQRNMLYAAPNFRR